MDQDTTWYGEDLGPGHTVLDGNSAPPERGTAAPSFRHMYCGQTAIYIKMALDTATLR